jgi:hypothetical protein
MYIYVYCIYIYVYIYVDPYPPTAEMPSFGPIGMNIKPFLV